MLNLLHDKELDVPYQTPRNYSKFVPRTPNQERVIETSGYLDPKSQIESMMYAGQRLDAFRQGVYDFTHEGLTADDDVTVDPTRSPYYDLADATRQGRLVAERLAEQKKAFAALQAQKKAEIEAADYKKLEQKIILDHESKKTHKDDKHGYGGS